MTLRSEGAMTDRELLELAAKAANIDAEWHNDDDADFDAAHEGMFLKGERGPANSKYWNPLTDDGDVFRLAVKLHMTVRCYMGTTVAQIGTPGLKCAYEEVTDRADPSAAARRAITRAAAEVGKAMP